MQSARIGITVVVGERVLFLFICKIWRIECNINLNCIVSISNEYREGHGVKRRIKHGGKLLLLGLLLIVLFASGCAQNGSKKVEANTNTEALAENTQVMTVKHAEQQSEQEIEKEDNSVRAIGETANGQLSVKPATHATSVPLGAPSCYGLERDIQWQGDYAAYWTMKGQDGVEKTSAVFTFPADFAIIQQNDAPITMQSFKLGDAELLAFVPRYTDCHGQETYFFGIENGEAFPVPLHMGEDGTWPNISQLPRHPLQVDPRQQELILTGGYGAGQEYINVYHFVYDAKNRMLERTQTEKKKPADLSADSTNS